MQPKQTQGDVKERMWDLFQNTGIPQIYALYAMLKADEQLAPEDEWRKTPRAQDERLR